MYSRLTNYWQDIYGHYCSVRSLSNQFYVRSLELLFKKMKKQELCQMYSHLTNYLHSSR